MLFFLGPCVIAAAQNFVGTGQNTLSVTVANNSGSIGDLTGVTVTAPSFSSQISGQPTITPVSANIPAGGQQVFQISFTIDAGAQAGAQGSLTYEVSASNPNSYPKVEDTSVSFKIDPILPRISISDSQTDLSVSTNTADPIPISNGRNIDILVEDIGSSTSPINFGSGPSRLEIWNGDVDQGTLIASSSRTATNYLYDFTATDIPDLDNLPAGILSIRAYDMAGSSSVVKINVAPYPAVTLSVGDSHLYDEFTGTPALSRSTLVFPQSQSHFTIQAAVNDSLQSITLRDPNQQPVPLTIDSVNGVGMSATPSQLPSNTAQVTGSFSAVNLGTYTFSAFGSSATVLPFRIVNLDVILDTNSFSTFNNSGIGQMTGFVRLDLASLVGFAAADQYYPPNLNVANTRPLSGNSTQLSFPISPSSLQYSDEVFLIKDLDGNTEKADFNMVVSPVLPEVALGPGAGSGNGSFLSPIYDSFAMNFLPGAVLRTGTYLHSNNRVETSTPVIIGYMDVPASGSYIDYSKLNVLMNLTVGLVTGNDPSLSGVSAVTLFAGSVSTQGLTGTVPTANFALGRYSRLETFFTSRTNGNYVNACQQWDPGDPANCLVGTKTVAMIEGIVSDSLGIKFNLSTGPVAGTSFALASNQSATLGMGWSVSNLNVINPGSILLSAIAQTPPPGYQSLPPNTAFDLGQFATSRSDPKSPILNSGPATFTFSYSTAGLTTGQLSLIKLSPADNAGNFGADVTDVSIVGNSIVFNADYQNTGSFGRYMLMVPKFPTPSLVTSGDISVLSNVPGITISSADPNGAVLNGLLKGVPVGSLNGTPYVLGPEGTRFPDGAVVTMNYIDQAGNPLNTLSELSVEHSAFILPGQYHGYQRHSVSGYLSQIASYFAPFATLPSSTDHTPPQTTFSFSSPVSTNAAGNFVLPVVSSVVLTAVDPIVPGEAASGIASTHYLIDETFVSLSSTPGSSYMMPFGLSLGSHTVTYFSVDRAGNQETPKNMVIVVSLSPDTTPPVSNLAFTGALSSATGNILISGDTLISLNAADSTNSNAVTSGVTTTYFLVDQNFVSLLATPPNAYTAPFALGGGTHTVTYFSADASGNLEAPKFAFFGVDIAPPATTPQLIGPGTANSGGVTITTYTFIALTAADPVVNGVASGVSDIFYVVDADPTSPACQSVALDTGAPNGTCANELYNGAFTLAIGTHTIYYWAEDNVLNSEPVNIAFITVTGGFSGSYMAVSPDGGATLTSNRSDATILNFSTSNASQAYQAATSQGLALIGSYFYMLQPNNASFNPSATLNLTLQGSNLSSAAIYNFNGTAWSSAAVTSQQLILSTQTSPHLTGLVAQTGAYAAFTVQTSSQPPPPPSTPTTILTVSDPFYAPSTSTIYAPGANSFSLSAASATQTFVALDTTTFSPYSVLFNIPNEGAHTLSFYSVNGSGAENPQTVSVRIDNTPPSVSLQVQGSSTTDAQGNITVSSGTHLAIAAFDPVVNGVASGVASVFYLVDANPRSQTCRNTPPDPTAPNGTCANLSYNGPFTLALGTHTVYFTASDKVQNQAGLNVATITVRSADVLPPRTAVAFGDPKFAGARLYLSSTTPVRFSAIDDLTTVVDGLGTGVAQTLLSIDSAAYAAVVSTVSLTSEGAHTLSWFSRDLAGNVEVAASTSVAVDLTPPVTQLQISAPSVAQASGTVVGPATVLSLSAQDPLSNGVASGVRDTFLAISTSVFALAPASFTLTGADGPRTVSFYSRDNVLNAEALKTAAVLLDATPPVTAFRASGAYYAADGRSYAPPSFVYALPAQDPAANGVASGPAATLYRVDAGSFTRYVSTFSLAEGLRRVDFQSADNVGNQELLKSATVYVDAAPPASSFAFGAPYYQAPDETNYVAPATPLTFTAQDPALSSGQPGSGVNRIEIAVDGGAFTVYTASLTFAEGRHAVQYRAIDNVGNAEATRALNVQSDATPPVTALALLGGHQFPGPDALSFFASADTRYGFPAVDPAVKNVAAGVAFTRWQDNGGAFQAFSAAFSLPEGVHLLAYQSQDNVQNLEVLRSTTALVDATPPVTSLLVSGGRQYPGPDPSTFYASSDTRLVLISTDPVTNGVASGAAFTQYQDNGGAFQIYLSSLTLAEGAHRFGYQSADNVANLEVLRGTNVWVDATPPATAVAIGAPTFTAADGTIYVATATPIAFAAADPALPSGQPGSGAARIETSLDGAAFALYAAPLTLAEGRHMILYRAIDNVGNVEAAHALALQSDATPPVSALVVGAPQFQLPSVLLVSSRTPFSIVAVDPVANSVASGVKDTRYRVSDVSPSTAAFAVYATPFAMAGADASKIIEFDSRDNVLNTEIVKSSTVLLDSTPPEIALLSPATCDSGICRVLKGKFPVRGTARDLHFGNYQLEFAAGQNAATGFALINAGTAPVSSNTLAVWDATALAGWFTVRLTATDLVANSASVSINVFVGDPGERMTLGNHEVFDMPEGVAVGGDGKIYVADRDNDRVAVFSSTGTLLASFGGRGHDDDDDQRLSTGTLRLHEPSGVAVDGAGNIYVADTNRDRVLKLSAAGRILLSLGRFHHPAGVAVDAGQNIYVADTENRRVQVFGSTGAFRLRFDLPAVPARTDHDDDRHDDHDDDAGLANLGKPFALTLDDAGNIYVADPKGGRALKFGATGQLLLTIPIAGDKPGSLGQPFGIAVSAGGECLLVSDRKYSRILKFDFSGARNLGFGTRGKLHDDDAPAPSGSIVFQKPMGLALDAAGGLFVADRNNDRVRKFALPTGQPPLVVPAPKPEDERAARDVVDKEDGGKIERKDRAAVEIPAGAVAQDLKVTVAAPGAGAGDESSRRRAADAARLKTASPPVEYGPEGTRFAAPVTLTLPYDPGLVARQGVDEADLKVHYWNRDKSQWQDLDSVVDRRKRTVTAKTTHFSLYQVFSGTAAPTALGPAAVGDPTFQFHDAYAFPNPVRGASVVTLRIQPGLADSVDARVYDLAGRKVYASSNFTLNPGLDDGNGKGAQYTYDHVWDVSGAGSGVYLYTITAHKAGQNDIRKTGKLGVIK